MFDNSWVGIFVKSFIVYTSARLALFAVVYGVLWLIVSHWIGWDPVSGLSTALVAMVISSLIAVEALRSLRNDLAAHVEARATRAKAVYDAQRAAEDADDAPREVAGPDVDPDHRS